MPQGLVSTYDLTVGVKLDISDMIDQLNPADVPLLGSYGADGRAILARDSCFEKKVEWLDDTILTPRGTISGAITTGTTSVLLSTANLNAFGVGDVILIENEYIRVSALSTDGLTLTVTRGYNSSTAVNHADLSVVVGVGTALPEGSDPGVARSVDRTNRYNLTEIFGPHKVQVSATENVVQKYGITTSEFDYQAGQRTKEVGIAIEQAILYGTRSDDTSNEWRTMGGLAYYFTAANGATVDSSTTTLTDAKLLDALQAAYALGGNPDTVVVGPKQKRIISSFETGSNTPLIRRIESGTRGTVVDTYVSDFGTVSVVLDRWARVNDLFAFNRNDVIFKTLNGRQLQFEMLAKTGDSLVGQIVCEHTLEVHKSSHQVRFSALT